MESRQRPAEDGHPGGNNRPVQARHSLSLGMVNPQIRLVQAATVPLSSSHLSPLEAAVGLPLAIADSRDRNTFVYFLSRSKLEYPGF